MNKIALYICMVLCFALTGCKKKTIKSLENHNILVVYFSHAGDNYAVGDIEKGNTKIVAEYICALTGADEYEIVTDKYDGMDYKSLCDLAQEEQIANERPAYRIVRGDADTIAPAQADFSAYDIVFVGSPVWWGTFPQVMFSFFDTCDLNDKIIIPFTTHEGSELGNCVGELKAAYPNADVRGSQALSVYGHEARTAKAQVETWLKKDLAIVDD